METSGLDDGMDRRAFLYTVGSATAAIAGWVLIPGCKSLHAPKAPAKIEFCPRLARDASIRRTDGGAEILRRDARGTQQVVCHVNRYGAQVLAGLDGTQSVQSLAGKLCAGLDPPVLAQTEASVASFLAALAEAGLLAEPFYVNLHAVEVTG